MTRQAGKLTAPPLTDEECERILAILEQLRRSNEVLLAKRGGKLFPRSADDLYELRQERERELP